MKKNPINPANEPVRAKMKGSTPEISKKVTADKFPKIPPKATRKDFPYPSRNCAHEEYILHCAMDEPFATLP